MFDDMGQFEAYDDDDALEQARHAAQDGLLLILYTENEDGSFRTIFEAKQTIG